ncbi:MAG: SDR family NAD(P)-dependent oxidoreductase, partial [Myxococcales bacterium]|nr:SDR family NAD(P)-dependent oxidoreductase [Myxococcales bacterium]
FAALAWGIGQVAALELPQFWGGLVDLPSFDDVRLAPFVLDAVLYGDGEDQFSVRNWQLHVRRLQPVAVTDGADAPMIRGASLVTGGTGALGHEVARRLVQRGCRHLILVSRSGQPVGGESFGDEVRVDYRACDVANPASVSALFSALQQEGVELEVIIHAAGISGSLTSLAQLERGEWQQVLAGKVLGAWNLHLASERLHIRHFVLFSSIAGVWGSGQQTAYSAANSFLAALARHRRAQGLPASAIAWGAWEIGMADEAQGFLQRQGIVPMSTTRALAALEYTLQRGVTDIVVAGINWDIFSANFQSQRVHPLLVILDGLGEPTTMAHSPRIGAKLERDVVIQTVLDSVARVMQLSHSDISRTAGLNTMGLDSLMAVELRTTLAQQGYQVKTGDLLRGISVDGIVGIVMEGVREHLEEASWLVSERANPDARVRLICFPYAGGGPRVYSGWADALGSDFEVMSVLLPGRDVRIDEVASSDFESYVDIIVSALLELDDRPLGMFGHCAGTVVMMEVARRLVFAHERRVTAIVASAAAPPAYYQSPQLYLSGESAILDALRMIGFTNSLALFNDDEFRQQVMPMLLADFEAVARYSQQYRQPYRLPVRIQVIGGLRDMFVAPRFLARWADYSLDPVDFKLFDEHHYYVESRRNEVLDIVRSVFAEEPYPTQAPSEVDETQWQRVFGTDDPPLASPTLKLQRDEGHERRKLVLFTDIFASGFP